MKGIATLLVLIASLARPGSVTAEESEPARVHAEEARRFRQRAAASQRTLGAQEERLRRRRLTQLDRVYSPLQRATEARSAEARGRAIAALSSFLRDHGDDPVLAPDARLRLAELLYDESVESHLEALERWEELERRRDRGEELELPGRPTRDHSRTIDQLHRLLADFPGAAGRDAALHLLALCLDESGRPEEAMAALRTLTCANRFPDPTLPASADGEVAASGPSRDPYEGCSPLLAGSLFADEAWFRLGELHLAHDYSQLGLDRARAAYSRVGAGSDLLGLARQRTGEALFRADRVAEALPFFVERLEANGGSPALRTLARRYLVVCLAEDDWNGDFLPDDETPISRLQDPTLLPQGRPWTPEVYVELADVFFDSTVYDTAIELYEIALRRWPSRLEAPRLIEQISRAQERERRFDEARRTLGRLAAYGEGSRWAEEHRRAQPERVEAVARLAREAAATPASGE